MQHPTWLNLPRTAIAVAVAVVAAAPALAQNTTSGINGVVTGPDGKPVAGATVTIVHVESGSTSSTISDSAGRFAARGLRAGGPYTVTFSKDGRTERREGLQLSLAETLPLDVQLGASQVITVTGQSAADRFNRSRMGAGTEVSASQLGGLPSIQRNLQDYARTDPRVAQTDKGRGAISALGQNARFNSLTIDGVSINDPFGLEDNNLPTLKQPISMDAIQTVQVNISNFDVTQKGYTGANINAVTRSGTNDFRGTVYYAYRSEDFAGEVITNRNGPVYAAPTGFTEKTWGFTAGGPVVKDKLFFFANYEELSSSRASLRNGPVGSSLFNVGITQQQIADVQTTARNVYGFEAGSFSPPDGVELKVKDLLLRGDWNLSDAQRINVRYSKTEQTEPIFPANTATILSLDSHWYVQAKTNESLVGQWFADWTPVFSTEFKVSQRSYVSEPLTNSNLPQVALVWTSPPPAGTTGTTRQLLIGTEQFRHFNRLSTDTFDTYLGGTWALGAHEVKAGADYQSNDIFNAFINNSKGVYEFRGADPVALFAAGVPSTYTVRVPLGGLSIADGAANWNLSNLGLFLQDNWRVNRNLSLMMGLRLDRSIVGDKPIRNPNFRADFGYDNDVTMDGKQLVQPRLGFNWNLSNPEGLRRQLRGGVGLFEGAAANVWLTNPYQNTGVQNASFTCGTSTSGPCPTGLAFTPNVNNQPQLSGTPPEAAVDLIDPGLRQPSLWKASLAFDSQLPWFGLVAGIEWVHTRVNSSINYRHLNLGAPTATASDGRNLYWNTAAQGTACWNGGDALVTNCGGSARAGRNTRYTDVLIAEETRKGSGNSVTATLSGRVGPSLNWNLGYTYTRSDEVSPLTSSTAISNWNNRAVYNPNEEIVGRSAYEIRDRVTGGVSWSMALDGKHKTTLGVFYEGRRGRPYSWTFRNDANGDGIAGNDLMYIPSGPGSGEVEFFGATPAARQANEDRFWAIVDGNPTLSGSKGRVVSRNSASAPWVNSFDVRLAQELPGFMSKHKAVIALDILNFGNLINRRWGRIDEVGFNAGTVGGSLNRGGAARSFVNYAGLSNGKYVYNTQTLESMQYSEIRLESLWTAQITLRYEF